MFNGADLHKTRMRLMLVMVGGKETERMDLGFPRRVQMNILDTSSHCVKLSKQDTHSGNAWQK